MNPLSKKKHNLALGNFLAYIIEEKYNIFYTFKIYHITSHFINHSFYIFYDGKRQPTQAGRQVEEEEKYS